MNKTAVLLVTLLIIFCLIASSLSFASYTPSRTIPALGTIEPTPSPTRNMKLGKGIALYGTGSEITNEELEYLAGYDFVDIDVELETTVPSIKAKAVDLGNPNCKVVFYVCCMTELYNKVSTESMFLHDTSGNRIPAGSSGGPYNRYLMDVSNQGYRDAMKSYLQQRLKYQWDGVFLDNTWQFWHNGQIASESRLNLPAFSKTAVKDYLDFIKTILGSKLLLCNVPSALDYDSSTKKYSTNPCTYWDVIDGIACEGWITWGPNYPASSSIIAEIDAVKTETANGKWFIGANFGSTATNLGSSLSEFQKFFYGCHVMASSNLERTGIAWFKAGYSLTTIDGTYFSEMDRNLGSPKWDYTIEGNILKRDFQNVHVEVNLNTHTTTIT